MASQESSVDVEMSSQESSVVMVSSELSQESSVVDIEIQGSLASSQESSLEMEGCEFSQESSVVMVEMASQERPVKMESLAMEGDMPRKEERSDTDRGLSSHEEEKNTYSVCGKKLMEEQDNICAEMYSMLSETKHQQKR